MGEFSHRNSQSDMRHNQNRKGGVEAQGQLRGGGDNRFGGWNTDLGEHPSCPDFLRHVLLVELLIVRFALRKSRIWARTSVIALIMNRDKGNCHQDVAPGSVKKTVSFKMQEGDQIPSLLPGWGFTLERGAPCLWTCVVSHEGRPRWPERNPKMECDQTYFSEYLSDGQLLKYYCWNNTKVLSCISMNFIQLCNTKPLQMQRNTIIFKNNRSIEFLPI